MTKLENMPGPGSPCSAWLGRGVRDEIAREIADACGVRPDDAPMREHFAAADRVLALVGAEAARLYGWKTPAALDAAP
jgi:hypothetical protein